MLMKPSACISGASIDQGKNWVLSREEEMISPKIKIPRISFNSIAGR